MDARAISEVARVGTGTLNVWIQRGLVPGVALGPRGRHREFDLDTAIHIALMVELVRLGLNAPVASSHAREHRAAKRWLLLKRVWLGEGVPVNQPLLDSLNATIARSAALRPFNSEEELPAILESLHHPAVYTVVNVERIVRLVELAQARWEQERAG